MALRPAPARAAGVTAVLALTALCFTVASPASAQPPIEDFADACEPGSDNPYLATTVFMRGASEDDRASVLAFRDTRNNGDQHALATAGDVGALYGLAYHGRSEILYAAAFHKRGTHFGPAGAGAIYAIDLRNGGASPFAIVPNAGGDTHDPTGDFFPDQSGRFTTTRVSLGDIDLNADGTVLFAANLFDRRIYRFAVPSGEVLGSFDHGAAGESWASDARLFALGYRDGWLYHGVVRSAESTQKWSDVWAFVYRSRDDGSDMSLVSSAAISFERGWIWPDAGRAKWNPWLDPPGQLSPTSGRYPTPILADIEFGPAGNQMVLGFRDRFGDQTFYTMPPNQPPPGEQIANTPAGDILPAFPSNGLWYIQTLPEYYSGDFGPNPTGNHDETSYGGLAVIPWMNRVVMSANSPLIISSAGGVWLDMATGEDVGREQVYVYNPRFPTFGKANGLGDVELLCNTLEESTPTPTPPATDTPTPTPTPTDTATVQVSETPTATATTVASATATRTATPSATASVTVAATSTPSGTPWPTATPTATPITAVPSSTPGPTKTPGKEDKPKDTPVPSTPELPRLPRTGGGGASRNADAALLVLAVVLFAAWMSFAGRRS